MAGSDKPLTAGVRVEADDQLSDVTVTRVRARGADEGVVIRSRNVTNAAASDIDLDSPSDRADGVRLLGRRVSYSAVIAAFTVLIAVLTAVLVLSQ